MTRKNDAGVSTPLVGFTTGSLFVWIAATENRPAWWIILTAIMLLLTGYSTFVDFHRRGK
ncbi:hypothetical protein HQQ82_08575 [Rathayibacter sp. VKM Ac-2856]|uniref:hypothetical protein n=1 Tax=unclassified Rathayibacter TaxID=2609250 RepID=UPI0015661B4A|nr:MULTISPECIES: hypothetical protein [unclassified Rathayibacter]NQX04855.1 hypothetical protein [Rathayibacter sp. VKM Ac-2858]NQX20023.1 hypothetical protein [Rathayibacter sp. VKM Ac-2856]